MWLCACASVQKRQHLKAKTTIVKLYICMNSCPQNKIDSPSKKEDSSKIIPMLELQTAPALSLLCGIFKTPCWNYRDSALKTGDWGLKTIK